MKIASDLRSLEFNDFFEWFNECFSNQSEKLHNENIPAYDVPESKLISRQSFTLTE